MAKDCEKHRGKTGSVPTELEDLMEELPENQSSAGRHKCPYCAYERGLAKGRERERERCAKWFGVSPHELPDFGVQND